MLAIGPRNTIKIFGNQHFCELFQLDARFCCKNKCAKGACTVLDHHRVTTFAQTTFH